MLSVSTLLPILGFPFLLSSLPLIVAHLDGALPTTNSTTTDDLIVADIDEAARSQFDTTGTRAGAPSMVPDEVPRMAPLARPGRSSSSGSSRRDRPSSAAPPAALIQFDEDRSSSAAPPAALIQFAEKLRAPTPEVEPARPNPDSNKFEMNDLKIAPFTKGMGLARTMDIYVAETMLNLIKVRDYDNWKAKIIHDTFVSLRAQLENLIKEMPANIMGNTLLYRTCCTERPRIV